MNIVKTSIEKRTSVVSLIFQNSPKISSIFVKFAKFFKIGKFGLAAVKCCVICIFIHMKFAIMISILLLIHEYGHIWQWKMWFKDKGHIFHTFFRSRCCIRESFKSRRDEVYIAIMGPIFWIGTICNFCDYISGD